MSAGYLRFHRPWQTKANQVQNSYGSTNFHLYTGDKNTGLFPGRKKTSWPGDTATRMLLNGLGHITGSPSSEHHRTSHLILSER